MICIIILLLSLVSVSHLTNVQLDQSPESIYVYELGLDDPEGELGISRVVIKSPNIKPYGLTCDQKSLYMEKFYKSHFGPNYKSDNFSSSDLLMQKSFEKDALRISLENNIIRFRVKGSTRMSINYVRETFTKNFSVGTELIGRLEAKSGDIIQIANPYGLTGTIIGLRIGKVNPKTLKGESLNDLNFKFNAITAYKLSDEKPVAIDRPVFEKTPLESLDTTNYRFKWFTNEKEGSNLPIISYPNGIMEFTESTFTFWGENSGPVTQIKLVDNNLQVKIDDDSPFVVLSKPMAKIHNGKVISDKSCVVLRKTFSIKVKEGDKIVILSDVQRINKVPTKPALSATKEALIEQLEARSLAEGVFITVQIVKNATVPKFQEISSINKNNNNNNYNINTTSTFQNNKNSGIEKKLKPTSSKGSDKIKSKKEAKNKNNLDLSPKNNNRASKVTVLVNLSSQEDQSKGQTIAKPNDQTLGIENNTPKIEDNVHEIDPVDNEISDRLQKVGISQPRKHTLKKSISTPNLRKTANFYTLSNINILKQTNLEELD